jgi:GNAT superfamily N-acetyltransferase
MIRYANLSDLPALITLGRKMHAESPRFSKFAFDAETWAATLERLIDSDDGFVMVAVFENHIIGMMVGLCSQWWFSRDRTATDLALFVVPEHRGGMSAVRLLSAFRGWCAARGVDHPQVGITTGIDTERSAGAYRRLGWTECGLIFEG